MPHLLRADSAAAAPLRPVRARPSHKGRRQGWESRHLRGVLPRPSGDMLRLRARAPMPWSRKREADMQFLSDVGHAAMRGLRACKTHPDDLAAGAGLQQLLLEDPRNARELPALR
jgi:hypothetical protein